MVCHVNVCEAMSSRNGIPIRPPRSQYVVCVPAPLFVFSIDGLKQNAGSLLTPVSFTICYVLSYGTLGFALHGSFYNHFLIGGNSSTANQIL